ncbi:MAG: UDP-glucose 4-epimerase GalE [Clostridiales bacterium]|nr:UDP-glucose 4-epimerase GalE [Clostridiales bacterium]
MILLTGGTGYIGSHTAVELLQSGEEIVIADDFSNSNEEVLKRMETLTGKKIPFYQIDVKDKKALKKVFEDQAEPIRCVIHFAGFKAVGESVKEPVKYYRNNLDTTLSLLEVMQEKQVKQFIFSSSATLYGKSKGKAPFTEDEPDTGCTNPYGWTKWMIEQILQDVCVADPEFSAVMLRYFNPIGAHESGLLGERPNGIPNNLMPYITQVAIGKLDHLRVFGDDYDTPDGTGVRDYIHVVDLAKGHVAACDYIKEHKGAEVINLGTGVGYSVLDIVHAFEEANGIRIPYEIVERRAGDVATMYADASKARRLLDWKAEKDLTQMCRDSWRFEQML